jgi:N-acetylglucosaminyl-diphospho-decaprenol L-rhamnosyltransferase
MDFHDRFETIYDVTQNEKCNSEGGGASLKICAVTLNYLGCRDTIACVRSLLGQGLSRIIIVENSGSDREREELDISFEREHDVDVITSGVNLGFAGGVNLALGHVPASHYDAFLLINNDTLAPPDLVEKLIRKAEEEALDLAAPLIYHYPRKELLWSQGNYYNAVAGLITRVPLAWLPGNIFYLTGCCLLVRREVFETIGHFDESFFMYGEDVDFCVRAERAGHTSGVVRGARIYHRVNAASHNNSLFYEYHINRGHFLLAKTLSRNRGERVLMTAMKIIVLGMRSVIRTMRFQTPHAVRGYVRALGSCMFSRNGTDHFEMHGPDHHTVT